MPTRIIRALVVACVAVLLAGVSCPDQVEVLVSPAEAELAPGAQQEFTATVLHHADARVTWSVTGGMLHGTSNTVTYTAPMEEGTFEVRATSVAEPTAVGRAEVEVREPPPTAAAPVAMDDHVMLLPGTFVIAIDVLANDTSPTGSRLDVVDIVEPPALGTAAIVADGQLVEYRAGAGFTGDTFRYRVRNAEGASATARVMVGALDRIDVTPIPILDLNLVAGGFDGLAGLNRSGASAVSAYTTAGTYEAYLRAADGRLTPLGTLGADPTVAFDLNDDGWVTGTASTAAGRARPFVWTEDTGMIGLVPPGGGEGIAMAIGEVVWPGPEDEDEDILNEFLAVVGAADIGGGAMTAVLWPRVTGTGAAPAIDLGAALSPGSSIATGVLSLGEAPFPDIDPDETTVPYTFGPTVVGVWLPGAISTSEFIIVPPAAGPQAFVWRDANGNGQADADEFTWLGDLGGGVSMATGINRSGLVVGQSRLASGETRGFAWRDGVMVELTGPPADVTALEVPPPTYDTFVSGLNDHGQVVGRMRVIDRESVLSSGIVWTVPATIEPGDLFIEPGDDYLPAGWRVLRLAAINDHGAMTGVALAPGGQLRAVELRLRD